MSPTTAFATRVVDCSVVATLGPVDRLRELIALGGERARVGHERPQVRLRQPEGGVAAVLALAVVDVVDAEAAVLDLQHAGDRAAVVAGGRAPRRRVEE